MKQHLSKLTCSALLGLGLVMAGSTAGSAAGQQIAGALASPVIGAVDTAASTTLQAQQVDYRGHHRHRHWRHRGGGSGIYFNFGGRGGGFSFGVTPRRYYRPAPRYYGYPQVQSSAHIRWCYSRYRSYRQWDNTFQPYHGSRRQCISPYY